MGSTLPGMPLAAGDPGVFLCKIPDGGLEPHPARGRAHARKPPPEARPGVWLVLALCREGCNYRTGRYCRAHDVRPFR